MITGINESKTLTRHISREYKSRFDGKKCTSDQWQNNDTVLQIRVFRMAGDVFVQM